MKQKRNRPRYNAQFKTFNSQQSCIDVFSKVESLFLQKFFRYNLSDYFHEHLANVEQDFFFKKLKHKQIKQLASECYLTKTTLQFSAFQNKVNDFYSSKSTSLENSQIPFAFKLLHANSAEPTIPKNEIVVVQVRMRAEIEKIENLPTYFYRQLEMCQNEGNPQEKDEQEVMRQLRKYGKDVINLFVVYYGDINFNLFNKEHYKPATVKFFGRDVKINIHVFYISRIALLQCFKKISKIENLQYINDLLIQLYEFKREKARNKRLKLNKSRHQPAVQPSNEFRAKMLWYLKWTGLFSVTVFGLGFLLYKFLF